MHFLPYRQPTAITSISFEHHHNKAGFPLGDFIRTKRPLSRQMYSITQ